MLDALHPMRDQVDLQLFAEMRRGRLDLYFLRRPVVSQGHLPTTVQCR
jgi:hypothetical protein